MTGLGMFRANTIGEKNGFCGRIRGDSLCKATENSDSSFSGDQNVCVTTRFSKHIQSMSKKIIKCKIDVVEIQVRRDRGD
jgi:hypothetical protein